MKPNLLLIGTILLLFSCTESQKKESNLKPLLSEQMNYSHDEENWFVPTKVAIEGLTAEQSNWKDSTDNHSIGEIIYHLTFWNDIQLRVFKGEDFSNLKVNNDTTFTAYTEGEWTQLTAKLDSIQTELQNMIEGADDKQLSVWAGNMMNIASHNAYHSGQILYIRKRNGWWK